MVERIRRVRPRVWLGALGVIVVLGFLEILAQHPVIPIGPIVPPALTNPGSTSVSASPAANGAPLVTDRVGPLSPTSCSGRSSGDPTASTSWSG